MNGRCQGFFCGAEIEALLNTRGQVTTSKTVTESR
jgi:hypothetical protein